MVVVGKVLKGGQIKRRKEARRPSCHYGDGIACVQIIDVKIESRDGERGRGKMPQLTGVEQKFHFS